MFIFFIIIWVSNVNKTIIVCVAFKQIITVLMKINNYCVNLNKIITMSINTCINVNK